MSIFIVGLPRCGSTLVESIISLNPNVRDLGELNTFEQSYREYKQSEGRVDLSKIYWEKSEITSKKIQQINGYLIINTQV